MKNSEILKRLFNEYTKKFVPKIILSVFFSLLVAGSTSAIAWLLDPAIKKLFIEKDHTLLFIIPGLIVLAFSIKGASLYIAKVLMIGVAAEVKKKLQSDMLKQLILADTQTVDNKHTGKFVSHLTYVVGMITALVSTVTLNIFKDRLQYIYI